MREADRSPTPHTESSSVVWDAHAILSVPVQLPRTMHLHNFVYLTHNEKSYGSFPLLSTHHRVPQGPAVETCHKEHFYQVTEGMNSG